MAASVASPTLPAGRYGSSSVCASHITSGTSAPCASSMTLSPCSSVKAPGLLSKTSLFGTTVKELKCAKSKTSSKSSSIPQVRKRISSSAAAFLTSTMLRPDLVHARNCILMDQISLHNYIKIFLYHQLM